MKTFTEIVKWGKVQKYPTKPFTFNSIDIETIDNEIFLLGGMLNDKYEYVEKEFYARINEIIIDSVRNNRHIVTWSRYDNTHIVKRLIAHLSDSEKLHILSNVGKITPLHKWKYNGYEISLLNIITDNVLLNVVDEQKNKKRLNIYNVKNLFGNSDLLKASEDYNLTYYSKLSEEYHIIERERYENDKEYREMVLKANYLDSKVVVDLTNRLVDNFKVIAGDYPRTIYTAGSLARAYLLTQGDIHYNIRSQFGRNRNFKDLTDYAMRAYYGGKIESYVVGYIPHAKVIDITSAYPYALSLLPRLSKTIVRGNCMNELQKYFYAFCNVTITIEDEKLIHPVSVRAPINNANISPVGTFDTTITKIEYDYLLKNGVKVVLHDFIAVKHIKDYPYRKMINNLFAKRLENSKTNKSISELYKLILNSLYGITYELTDVYDNETGEWLGYRAGDFFNPIIASYITAITRTYLSNVSNNIINNGGDIFLNMTDSIIYNGNVTLDVFSDDKVLGKFEAPTIVKDVIILGAGRYEYMNDFTKDYTIKTRGFSVRRRDKSFYTKLSLNGNDTIKTRMLVTFFKATTQKYSLSQLGHLVEDDYKINPLNLGGKRIIVNENINLKREYTRTLPVRL